MSSFPAFRSRRSPDDAALSTTQGDELHADVFNLIPPRVEELDRPTFERPYGLHRPVDLDVAALEAVRAQREAELAATTVSLTADLAPSPAPEQTVDPSVATPVAVASTSMTTSSDRLLQPAPASEKSPRPVGGMDLTRLSIDNEGRLFWDGKPVDTHHRLQLSRRQSVGFTVIGALILVAALGGVMQGATAAHDLGCRLGWFTSACANPNAAPTSLGQNFPS